MLLTIFIGDSMASNPLEKYYRQPKFYINLPSQGAYNTPGTIVGDTANIPVYGMTGIDEIIVKTPDALLSGESTAMVVQSCVPAIQDAWQMSMLDADLVFAAIKIATWGNEMSVTHTCGKCQQENDYDLDLSIILDHYATCKFENKVVIGELVVKLKPITYRQYTDFNLENFKLQQQLKYAESITDEKQKQELIDKLWNDLALSQNNVFVASIDSVETPDQTVTERGFIVDWLKNCDKVVVDAIKKQIAKNRENWTVPTFPVKCTGCDNETSLSVDLDYSSFFDKT